MTTSMGESPTARPKLRPSSEFIFTLSFPGYNSVMTKSIESKIESEISVCSSDSNEADDDVYIPPKSKSPTLEAIVAITTLVVIVSLIRYYFKNSNFKDVCTTDSCFKSAQLFSQCREESTDPCDNFYHFACGRFNSSFKEGQSTLGLNHGKVLRQILDQFESSGLTSPAPIRYIQRLFEKAAVDTRENLGWGKLDELRGAIEAAKSIEELISYSETHAIPSIVDFGAIPDTRDNTRRILAVDRPLLTLGRKDLLANSSDSKASNIRKEYMYFIARSFKLLEPSDRPFTDYENKAKEIIQLEIDLANITMKEEDRRDPTKTYRRLDKKYLAKNITGIDLVQVIDSILGSKTVDTVVVGDLDYFANLANVLEGKLALVKRFATWKLVEAYGWLLSTEFMEECSQFYRARGAMVKFDQLMLSAIMKVAEVTGRAYVDSGRFLPSHRDKVIQMVEELKKSVGQLITEKEWMDNATKSFAIEKLNQMTFNIGYPEWIKDDIELTKCWDLDYSEDDDLFDLVYRLQLIQVTNIIDKMDTKIDPRREWPISASSTNAVYLLNYNSITLPAALFNSIFFASDRPDYLNFAAVGMFIAHEMFHAFDDQGAKFDSTGNVTNWWSDAAKKEFTDASNKLIEQYGSIKDKKTNLVLDGSVTLGENIADNGALRATYNAYFDLPKENEAKLVAHRNWSKEKLFFLSFATSWCESETQEVSRNRILYDHHPPAEYRVNVPLWNFEPFALAFGCKVGSRMNPENKVRVW